VLISLQERPKYRSLTLFNYENTNISFSLYIDLKNTKVTEIKNKSTIICNFLILSVNIFDITFTFMLNSTKLRVVRAAIE